MMLKNKLVEAPVLALYNHKDEVELHCDASLVSEPYYFKRKKMGKCTPFFIFPNPQALLSRNTIVLNLKPWPLFTHGVDLG